MTFIEHTVDTETGCGRELADWPITFLCEWQHDYDNGWIVQARVHRTWLHNLPVDRHTLILLLGEVEVNRIETEAEEAIAPTWREHMPEAAE